MRIVLDASFCTGSRVGIATYISRLVPELARLCDLTVLTSLPGIFEPHSAAGHDQASHGFGLVKIPVWTRTNRGRFFWQLTELPSLCRSKSRLSGSAVLLCTTPVAPPCCPLPVISVVHDLTPLRIPSLHHTRTKLLFWLHLQTLRRADAVITDSKQTRDDLLKLHLIPPSRVRTVYPGPGIEPFSSADRNHCERKCAESTATATTGPDSSGLPTAPFILYVGGHMPNKNVPRLVRAFSRIRTPEDLQLVIVGWGRPDDIRMTEEAVRRHGLSKRVTIHPHLPDHLLSELYRRALLFVFPSLYEGFGLPVLEAMAHGCPTACSSAASLPEIAGDAAIYFDPGSVDSIQRSIELILANPALADDLSRRARRRAAAFSWSTTARAIHAIAGSLVRS